MAKETFEVWQEQTVKMDLKSAKEKIAQAMPRQLPANATDQEWSQIWEQWFNTEKTKPWFDLYDQICRQKENRENSAFYIFENPRRATHDEAINVICTELKELEETIEVGHQIMELETILRKRVQANINNHSMAKTASPIPTRKTGLLSIPNQALFQKIKSEICIEGDFISPKYILLCRALDVENYQYALQFVIGDQDFRQGLRLAKILLEHQPSLNFNMPDGFIIEAIRRQATLNIAKSEYRKKMVVSSPPEVKKPPASHSTTTTTNTSIMISENFFPSIPYQALFHRIRPYICIQDSNIISEKYLNFYEALEKEDYTQALQWISGDDNHQVAYEIAKILLEHQPLVRMKVNEVYQGNIAIHSAFEKNNWRLVKLLANHGANTTLKNSKGVSANDLADKWNKEIISPTTSSATTITTTTTTNATTITTNVTANSNTSTIFSSNSSSSNLNQSLFQKIKPLICIKNTDVKLAKYADFYKALENENYTQALQLISGDDNHQVACEVAKILLEHQPTLSISINAFNQGKAAIHNALGTNNWELVNLLVKYGADTKLSSKGDNLSAEDYRDKWDSNAGVCARITKNCAIL